MYICLYICMHVCMYVCMIHIIPCPVCILLLVCVFSGPTSSYFVRQSLKLNPELAILTRPGWSVRTWESARVWLHHWGGRCAPLSLAHAVFTGSSRSFGVMQAGMGPCGRHPPMPSCLWVSWIVTVRENPMLLWDLFCNFWQNNLSCENCIHCCQNEYNPF